MKALIQRVKSANVSVNGQMVGEIGQGVLAYIGIGKDDDFAKACKLIDKLLTYRIFANDSDKLDKSVIDIDGGVLLVSQFTLMANTKNGRRADFTPAMPPADARVLFDQLIAYARSQYPCVATGQFGANMQVHTQNDGPINFILEV